MKDLTTLLSLDLPAKLSKEQAQRIADEILSLRAENEELKSVIRYLSKKLASKPSDYSQATKD